jgi:flagellar hook assembly protein FlgD
MQNYPNPFNSSTVIHFNLPTSDIIYLSIYNIAGQQVATLAQGMRQAGTHVINWNGKDDNEHALASGLYFYRLQSSTHQQTRKLILLR